MKAQRREPSDCQFEPRYPGLRTVVFSIRFPHLTAHEANELCAIEGPHEIAECGEWKPEAR